MRGLCESVEIPRRISNFITSYFYLHKLFLEYHIYLYYYSTVVLFNLITIQSKTIYLNLAYLNLAFSSPCPWPRSWTYPSLA